MGMRRAHDIAAGLSRQPHIVDVAAPSAQETKPPSRSTGTPFDCTLIISIPSQLAVPADHAAPARSGEAMTERVAGAVCEAAVETIMETVMEAVEPLHDEDRRPETKITRRAPPIGKVVGISVARRIRIRGIGRRRNLIHLGRQSGRVLGNSPTAIRLLTGLDARLLLLAADGHRNGVAVASGRRRGRLRIGVLSSGCPPGDRCLGQGLTCSAGQDHRQDREPTHRYLRVGSSPSLTTSLPKLRPCKRPTNASGARSRASTMSSRYLSSPLFNNGAAIARYSPKRCHWSLTINPWILSRLRTADVRLGPGRGSISLYSATMPHITMRPKSLSRGNTACCTAPPTFSQ